ncbi:MAG: signal transduction histidine kinase [Caulobacteraceae bacterium]|jgi:two-component sensor histidine kinase|nr:signal transduction histidine kinase [Caulobacteraceae bacterium]
MSENFGFDDGLELAKVKELLLQREYEFRELNHRVANSLQITAGFLTLHQKRLGDGAAKEALVAASARIKAIAKLHRFLYANGEAPQVDLKTFFEDLCPDIAASTGLICSVDVEPLEVSGETAKQLAIIVNEFAINARKHAYDGEDGGTLQIEGRREAERRLRLTIADGGSGLPDGFDLADPHGFGLSIVSMMVKQLDAELIAENDHGARFTLFVPMPQNSR